jgi:hypothetical protein
MDKKKRKQQSCLLPHLNKCRIGINTGEKMIKTRAILIIAGLLIASAAFGQAQLQPARVEMKIQLLPEVHLIKVDFALNLQPEMLKDGKLFFGIGEQFKIKSVFFSKGQELKFSQSGEDVAIEVGKTADWQSGKLHILYEAKARSTRGRTAVVDPKGSYFSWLGGWIPFLPATSGFVGTASITAPADFVVTTQGILTGEEVKGDNKTTSFKVNRPCYFSLMAAPYNMKKSEIGELEFRTYFLSGSEDKHDFYKQNLAAALKGIEKSYGPYPYEYLTIIQAPEIPGLRVLGSSEQGMMALGRVACSDDYFNFPILVHELAHMWFGNWVIGDEILVSETFAQLGYFLALEDVFGEEIMRRYILSGSPDHFMNLQLYLRYFADGKEKEPLLTVGSYGYPEYLVIQGKGPSVFLMLREHIGREAFARGFANVVKKHAHTRMPLELIKQEWEKASGKNLDEFFLQWIKRPGAPHLKLEWKSEKVEDGFKVFGAVSQTAEPFFSLPVEIVAFSGKDKESHVINLTSEKTEFAFRVDQEPENVALDPQRKSLWIAAEDKGKTEFAKAKSFRTTYAETLEVVKKYYRKNPDDKFAQATLANYLGKLKPGEEETLSMLEKVIKENEADGSLEIYRSWAMLQLAREYQKAGREVEAAALFKRLMLDDRTGRYRRVAEKALSGMDVK